MPRHINRIELKKQDSRDVALVCRPKTPHAETRTYRALRGEGSYYSPMSIICTTPPVLSRAYGNCIFETSGP